MIALTDKGVPVLITVAVTDEEKCDTQNTVVLSIGAGTGAGTAVEIEAETIEMVVN